MSRLWLGFNKYLQGKSLTCICYSIKLNSLFASIHSNQIQFITILMVSFKTFCTLFFMISFLFRLNTNEEFHFEQYLCVKSTKVLGFGFV